jgi:hypothetical protein
MNGYDDFIALILLKIVTQPSARERTVAVVQIRGSLRGDARNIPASDAQKVTTKCQNSHYNLSAELQLPEMAREMKLALTRR